MTIPVPSSVFSALPPSASKPGLIEFQLIPIFFNIGVNEQALLADRFGDMSSANATNQQGYVRLENYHRRYQKLMTEFFPGKRKFYSFVHCFKMTFNASVNFILLGLGDSRQSLSDVLTQLQSELASEKVQNITIHQLAETAVRKMKGIN